MSQTILLKSVLLVDSQNETTGDMLIQNGKIEKIGRIADQHADVIIQGHGRLAVCPGLFDMHVHLRDPGQTHKEDIHTGLQAAMYGGFTGVACMPNTVPPVDAPDVVRYILDRALEEQKYSGTSVYPVACITRGMSSQELCDFQALRQAGAVAFSDDGRPVKNAELLRQALAISREMGLLMISHCEDMDIIGNGVMHKGEISQMLGVPGMDRASEDSITAREIALAAAENAPVHIAHVSTRGSIELIRDAKRRGVAVTCETAAHYFMYTEEKLARRDANYRMNPPLREEADRLAVLEAVLDGTIDCIITDHAPHTPEEKADFSTAPNGVIGMETSLAACLTVLHHGAGMPLSTLVERMSAAPRRILGLPALSLEPGASAELTVFDPDKKWTVHPENLHSKARNAIFAGETFTGCPLGIIAHGKAWGDFFQYS